MRFFATLITLIAIRSYGQAKKEVKTFPTYQQIKPASSEIIDYVPGQRQTVSTRQIDLLGYPADSVTYVLNAQPTTDKKYVKELLSRKDIEIGNVVIERPDANGKRRIIINFTPR
ncbi:hypothetical protein GCM10027592_19640 [Spirosoma flavus]